MKLLSISSDAKTVKGESKGYLTAVLYMRPGGTVCPAAEAAGCLEPCLSTSGRLAFTPAQRAQIERRRLFEHAGFTFLDRMTKEIQAFRRKAERKGLIPALRLNGTSDVPWESWCNGRLMAIARDNGVVCYDYTKRIARAHAQPYDLTMSWSGGFPPRIRARILQGCRDGRYRLAVVFRVRRGDALPTVWEGIPVVDGDQHDLRFLEPRGVVVGLRAKGRAIRSDSPFVVDLERGDA